MTPEGAASARSDAEAWDARVAAALAKGPSALARWMGWLRVPHRRWLRIPAGGLLVLGGLLSILPVLGLWMLPLGLALLGEDIPALKGGLERSARWLERRLGREPGRPRPGAGSMTPSSPETPRTGSGRRRRSASGL